MCNMTAPKFFPLPLSLGQVSSRSPIVTQSREAQRIEAPAQPQQPPNPPFPIEPPGGPPGGPPIFDPDDPTGGDGDFPGGQPPALAPDTAYDPFVRRRRSF